MCREVGGGDKGKTFIIEFGESFNFQSEIWREDWEKKGRFKGEDNDSKEIR